MIDRTTTRFPSDRAYGRLHWSLMGLIAAMLLYGLVLSRWVETPRGVGIRLIALLILSFNALWWSIADRRFARFILGDIHSRLLRLAVFGLIVALNAPIIQLLINGRPPSFQGAPTWYATAVTLWTISLPLLMPVIALLRLAGMGAKWAFRRLAGMDRSCQRSALSVQPQSGGCRAEVGGSSRPQALNAGAACRDPDRRAFLRTAVATAPVILLGGLTGICRAQERGFLVNRHTLPAPWLPDRLRGLTITHISDLHVGRLYRPSMLPMLVNAAGALHSDLVVVTGDIVDNSNEFLPPAIDALSQITHRHGLFLCIGNHDQIDSRQDFIHYTRSRLPLLVNERRSLDIGGERLTIAGLDYASSAEPSGRGPGYIADIAGTLAGHDPRAHGPVIALAHHPHEWDWLAWAGVPLTLSGHTHGGQIMFTSPGERPDVGVGRLLFRYTRGFYRTESSTLFVNSGVGNWFPLRVRAPAEIVQIQLT